MNPDSPLTPLVTIIMPVRNEVDFIERSLTALVQQDYPPDCLEIFVVDGDSDDGTPHYVTHHREQNPASTPQAPVCLLNNPARYMPIGFNLALREARGDIIIVVGGHCLIASDYVRQCVHILAQTGADCVGGPMVTQGGTYTAQAIAQAQSSPFGVGGVAFRTGQSQGGYVDTVAFGAYRREVFSRIGTFDEELIRNQDDEFNFRLTQAGGKIWLDPSIQSVYYSRASLPRLWRQYYQYGLYKVRVIQKRKAVPSWRHLVPALFVLSLCLSLMMTLLTGKLRWSGAVVLPYLGANLLATAWAARQNWALGPMLPLAFATLHLAYGFGFLAGLWRWRSYWTIASPN